MLSAVQAAVLVVDDEVRSQEALRRTLEEEFTVFTAAGAGDGRAVMEREQVRVILCDQRMPGTSGVAFLREVRERWPDTVRIIISGYSESDDIIAGINEAGIWQYLLKPWHPDALLLAVRAAAQLWDLQRQSRRLDLELRTAEPVLRRQVQARQERVQRCFEFDRLTRAPGSPLDRVVDQAERVAGAEIAVHLCGESGTGKELLARAIHYASPRAGAAFVIENCGAVQDSLLESELFGHKRGSFTGAFEDRTGLFEQADGGTLFLDEIGDASPAFQVRLLRVLQEGEIRPVGTSRSRRVDVRIISATNRDLEADVRRGRFREDLYYRLTQFVLPVPALRARRRDIAPIACQLLAAASGGASSRLTDEALECLAAYDWPGNVRELQNELLRALALADGDGIGAHLFSPRVMQALPRAAADGRDDGDEPGGGDRVDGAGTRAAQADAGVADLQGLAGDLRARMEALEARVLREALIRHRWNKTRAAAELGLSRVGLRSKLARHGLERKQ